MVQGILAAEGFYTVASIALQPPKIAMTMGYPYETFRTMPALAPNSRKTAKEEEKDEPFVPRTGSLGCPPREKCARSQPSTCRLAEDRQQASCLLLMMLLKKAR